MPLATLLAVVVAAAGYVCISGARSAIESQWRDAVRGAAGDDFAITTAGAAPLLGHPFENDTADALQALNGVESISTLYLAPISTRASDAGFRFNFAFHARPGLVLIAADSKTWTDSANSANVELFDSPGLPAAMITSQVAALEGVAAGDTLDFRIDGRWVKTSIVGILPDRLIPGRLGQAIMMPMLDVLPNDARSVTEYRVRADTASDRSELLEQIRATLPRSLEVHELTGEQSPWTIATRSVFSGMLVVNAATAIIALTVVACTMSAAVRFRTKELEILHQIGWSSRRCIAVILAEATSIGAVGGLLGAIIGAGASIGVTEFTGTLLEAPAAAIRLPWTDIVSVTVVSSAACGLAAVPAFVQLERSAAGSTRRRYGPALFIVAGGAAIGLTGGMAAMVATERSPASGMVVAASIAIAAPLVLGHAFVAVRRRVERVFRIAGGPDLVLAYSQLCSDPGRLLGIVILNGTLLALVVTAMTSASQVSAVIDGYARKSIYADAYIYGRSGLRASIGNALLADPAVKAVHPVSFGLAKVAAGMSPPTVPIVVTQYDTERFLADTNDFLFIDPSLSHDDILRSTRDRGQALIASTLASRLGITAGDSIQLLTLTGLHRLPIAAVMLDFTNNGYAVSVPRTLSVRLFGHDDVDIYNLTLNSPDIANDYVQSVNHAERTEAGNRLFAESGAEYLDRIGLQVDQLLVMVRVASVLSLAFGGIGAGVALLITTQEQARAFERLHTIGLSRRRCRGLVRSQSMVVAALGTLGGLPGSVLLPMAAAPLLSEFSGFGVAYTFETTSMALPIVVLVVSNAIAGTLASRLVLNNRVDGTSYA